MTSATITFCSLLLIALAFDRISSKTKVLTVILLLTGSFFSCKKDNEKSTLQNTNAKATLVPAVHDTIKPLDYFPAFPGSYWVYDNGDTLKVADHYEQFIFNAAGFTGNDYDTLVLPKLILNGIYNGGDAFAYVNHYLITKAKNSDYKDPAFKTLLSLTEGEIFMIGFPVQGNKISGKTIKTDTTIYIGSQKYEHVIVTITFDESGLAVGYTPEEIAFIREYYAKDIGLIKREKRDTGQFFVKDIELVNYMVKK